MTRPSVPPTPLRTARLFLRCWESSDAPRFKRALDASLAEMQPWIPWTRLEPSPLDVLEARLAGYHDDFHAGRDALYAILDEDGEDVMGGVGLYRRVGPGALEIGYWIRSDLAGRGYATEAAEALTRVGLTLEGVVRLEIRCDAKNGPSSAIPRKLGYRHDRTEEIVERDGGGRSLMIWVLERGEAPPSP